ncbi:MAG: hypothetical protein FWG84_06300 [Bacteroidales bacterium]|nr:hypothetical protein [Bacteroidales bacterium]
MSVLFLPEIQEYFDDLEIILYEKEYFGYEGVAHKYVDDLIFDIKHNLPNARNRPAPKHYEKYGKGLYYATFKKNRRTQWYAFFSKYVENGETIYLVCYIGNNHTEAQHFRF